MENIISQNIIFQSFLYSSPNGLISGFGVFPNKVKNVPLIIYCRGGNRDFGKIDHRNIANLMLPLALEGFAVFGSQYSGTPGSEGNDEYGGDDVKDIFALLDELKKSNLSINFSKIGLYGFSRGVMMGMQALRDGFPATCAVFVGGLYDMQQIRTERQDIYDMIKRDSMFDVDNPDEIAKRSAVMFAEKLPDIPYLLLHSEEDWRVPVRQAKDMKEKLGNRVELKIFDGDDHGLGMVAEERNRLAIEWFKKM